MSLYILKIINPASLAPSVLGIDFDEALNAVKAIFVKQILAIKSAKYFLWFLRFPNGNQICSVTSK